MPPPPPCVFCSKRFSSSYFFRKHIRLHTGEKPHFCGVCRKEFCTKAEKLAHMRSHDGSRERSRNGTTTPTPLANGLSGGQSKFHCPLCKEIPPREIYQCKEGHTLCHQCFSTATTCPEPGCPLPIRRQNIRNRALELVMDDMTFPCRNQNKGCTSASKRGEIKEHLEICTFQEVTLQLCSLLGFPCEFETSMSSVEAALSHFEREHGITSTTAGNVNMIHKAIGDGGGLPLPSLEITWAPVVVQVGPEAALVLFSGLHNKKLSVKCLFLGEPDGGFENLEVAFSVSMMRNGNLKDLKWKITPVALARGTRSLDGLPSICIPVDILGSNPIQEGVTLAVNIIKDGNPRQVGDGDVKVVSLAVRHNGITSNDAECGACGASPLIPVRYKCLQCADYNLCQKCMSTKKVHSEHLFALLKNDKQQQHLLRIGERGSSRAPILPSGGDRGKKKSSAPAREHFEARCDSCGDFPITGIRYTCLMCPTLDFCPTCVDSGVHQHHIFGVIINSAQEDFVRGLQHSEFAPGLIPWMEK